MKKLLLAVLGSGASRACPGFNHRHRFQRRDLFKIAQDIKRIRRKRGHPDRSPPNGGSFENINLLAAGKVDLAIMQLDVLRFVAEIMLKETGLSILEEAKVALDLYLEEIRVVAKNPEIRTLAQLQGKRVAIEPRRAARRSPPRFCLPASA